MANKKYFFNRYFAVSAAVLFFVLFSAACGSSALKKNAAGGEGGDNSGEAFISNFGKLTFGPPQTVRFRSAQVPRSEAAPGVGLITRDQRDLGTVLSAADKSLLTGSFKTAYSGGLSRGLPLSGVLGGDEVHAWPPAHPVAWVQNWQSGETSPNSWSAPSLVLAVRGLAQEKVFIVRGAILDAYGRSAGQGGANGAAGYGAPRGDDFFYQGGIAQRFDFGLITADVGGKAVFISGDPPSAGQEAPDGTGVFPPEQRESSERGYPLITEAFRSAWANAVDKELPPLTPDTQAVFIDFESDPWIMDGLPAIRGIYYQTFGAGKALFLLADFSPDGSGPSSSQTLSFQILASPFFEALLTGQVKRLPGAEALSPAPVPKYRTQNSSNFTRALLEGISLYGFPLSDAQAVQDLDEPGTEKIWQEAQRFSKGWMIRD
ncbi:MAG: hypothetical protein LBN21_05700 [Treponema sp.]|jgi:hypothetical protein|nr:hypothetical protein [Treponema sp.]